MSTPDPGAIRGLATGLWASLTRDVKATIDRLTDVRRVQAIEEDGRVTIASTNPDAPAPMTVSRLRGSTFAPGDDVVTMRVAGYDVAIGTLATAADMVDNGQGNGPGGTPNQSIDVYGPGLGLITSNPAVMDFKNGFALSEPVPDVVRLDLAYGGNGTATTVARSDHTHVATWDVLIVIPYSIRYQGTVRAMTTKERSMCETVARQFSGLYSMASGGLMDVRARGVFRETTWDLDADLAAIGSGLPGFGTGVWIDAQHGQRFLDTYNGRTYDAQVIMVGKAQIDSTADGLTTGGTPGWCFLNIGDGNYDFYAGQNRLADVLVHEMNHQVESRMQNLGLAISPVDGSIPGTTGAAAINNEPHHNWFSGYIAWWDYNDFSGLTDDGHGPTVHADTLTLPDIYVDPDNGWGVFTTGGTGDYNQSIDVFGTGVGQITSNLAYIDVKDGLLATEPTVDGVRLDVDFTASGGSNGTTTKVARGDHTHAAADIASGIIVPARLGIGTASATTTLYGDGTWKTAPTGGTSTTWNGGDVTAATHYRNVAVDGDDSASVRRWAMYSSGTFESYDANGFVRASLGNGSLSLYDSLGTQTVYLPTTGNPSVPPRFAVTPTVGASGSAVNVSLTGHTHVKGDVGLGNVDNTSDASKPVSTPTQTALDAKAPLASPAFTGTPTGITKAHVGLGNVDNTADTAKPISTATQAALDSKSSTAHTVSRPTSNFTTTATGTVVPTATLGITVGANEVWEFVIDLFTGCSGTGGTKWGIYCTQAATLRGSAIGMAAIPTAVTSASLTTNAGLSGVAFNTAARQDGWVRIAGIIANGATAGTFYPVWGAGVAGETSTLYTNSLIVAHRIG